MKKLLTLAVCFSAMFVFYGCGDGNASQAAKEKKEAEIKECMNNMTRLKKNIVRYANKNKKRVPRYWRDFEDEIETSVSKNCPVSDKAYTFWSGMALYDYMSKPILECKCHEGGVIKAYVNGETKFVPQEENK